MRRLLVCFTLLFTTAAAEKPNILFILCDDLGYGDVRALNKDGKIPTPNIDRLAREGMIFTDAHSSSAVCTPTRYGIMTGRYNWRSRLKKGVLGGMSPPLLEPGRLTAAQFLRDKGYQTACIGKWHLGLDWQIKAGAPAFDDNIEKGEEGWRVDFSKPFQRGPLTAGFDYYFGIAASLDMVPYTFLENDRAVAMPSTNRAFPMMEGRPNRTTRRGPAAADFEAVEVLPTLRRKAEEYLGTVDKARPFFLYLAWSAPHTPIVPSAEWRGRTGLNPYGDFVAQVDAETGRVLDRLNRLGLSQSTLVIFTSDNGCSPEAKFDELKTRGHSPSAGFRGAKADIFEGGHRIPFLVRWPGRVPAGSRSDQLLCLNDLFATAADILKTGLPRDAAEDSFSFLPALEGRASKGRREAIVHHSINGSFAVRQGNWKLELCPDSGGWSSPVPGSRSVPELPVQLYDLRRDPGETNNLALEHPEVVSRLSALLEEYKTSGRSRP